MSENIEKRAIVVDDDEMAITLMRIFLQRAGISVLGSYLSVEELQGDENLDLEEITHALVDHNMPKQNGKDAAEYLRRQNENIKILGISDSRQNQEGYVDTYLGKNTTLDKIKTAFLGE